MDYQELKITSLLKFVRIRYNKDPLFFIAILAVAALAIFFRFYNYFDRLVILADNSRDAQIGFYAAKNFLIPQIGPFSQAPFFFGPWWYWFIALSYILSFFSLLSPWFIMTIFSFLFLYLIFWLGNEIGGKWLAALSVLMAAISPVAISNYFSIWNPSIIPILTLVALIILIRYYKTRKTSQIFLLGFVFSLATVIHFQAILTMPVLLIAFLLSKQKAKSSFFLFCGVLIPFLPFLIFDLRNNWFWTKSAFIHFVIDQPTLHFPNRWITYAFSFWPQLWSNVVGTNRLAGGTIIGLLSLFFLRNLRNFPRHKPFYIIAAVLILEVIMYRYYRGERQIYYNFFTHPLIIILTSWVILQFFKLNRYLALIFLVFIFTTTFTKSTTLLKDTPITLNKVQLLKKEIYAEYPNSNFDIYGCKSSHGSYSKPLSLVMYMDKRNFTNGIKIGVCETEQSYEWKILSQGDFHAKSTWTHDTTSFIYEDNIEWFKKNPPPKGSDFWEFIKRKIDPRCWPHCD